MQMIIKNGKKRTLHKCTTQQHSADLFGYIPEYYSNEHATDAGWVATRDVKFCPPPRKSSYGCAQSVLQILHGIRSN